MAPDPERQSLLHTERPPIEYRSYANRWVQLFLYSFLSLLNGMVWLSASSISNLAEMHFHVSNSMFNWLPMSFYFVFISVAPFSASAIDRFGLANVLRTASFFNGVGAALRALSYDASETGFYYLLAGQIVMSVASPLFLGATTRVSAVWFGEKQRTLATSIIVALGIGGLALGFLVPTMVVHQVVGQITDDFNRLNCVLGGICVVHTVFALLLFRDYPKTPPSVTAPHPLHEHAANVEVDEMTEDGEDDAEIHKESRLSALNDHDEIANVWDADMSLLSVDTAAQMYSGVRTYGSLNHSAIEEDSQSLEPLASYTSKKTLKAPKTRSKKHTLDWKAIIQQLFLSSARRGPFLLCFFLFGSVSGLLNSLSTLLNEIMTREGFTDQQIVLPGTMLLAAGLPAMIVSSIIVDKSRNYRLLIFVGLIFSTAMLCAYSILLQTSTKSIGVITTVMAFAGLFLASLQPIILEYGVECTYPIPEMVPCTLFYVSAQGSAILITLASEHVVSSLSSAPWILTGLCGFWTVAFPLLFTYLHRGKESVYLRLQAESSMPT